MKRLFYLSILFASLSILFSGNAFAQTGGCQINLGIITPNVCVGNTVCIPFTLTNCQGNTPITVELAGPLSSSTATCSFDNIALSNTGNCFVVPLNFQQGTYCVRLRRGNLVSVSKSFLIDTIDNTPAPIVQIVQVPPIRPSYCKGDTVRFRIASITNGGVGYSLQWSRNDTARNGDTSSVFTVTNLGDGDYISASVTRQNKCAQNATGRSDSLIISVNKPPVLTLQLRPGSTGCENTINSFVAKLQVVGPDPTIIWTRKSRFRTDTLSQGINDTLFTLSPADSAQFGDTIRAKVIAGRCGLQDDDFFVIRACGEVLVNAPLDSAGCAGSVFPVPYKIIGSFAQGNVFTVQLSDSNGSFASPVQIGNLASIRPDTIQTLLPPDLPGGNCFRVRILATIPPDTSDTSACFKVFPRPEKPLTVNDSVCGSGEVTLSASSLQSGISFNWYADPFSDRLLFTGPSRTFTIQADSVYYVSAVSSRGCESERSEVRAISNSSTPVEIGSDQSFCEGNQTFAFSPSISGGIWSGALPVINNQIDLTGVIPGTYKLVYQTVNNLGCPASDSLTVTVKGIPEPEAGADFITCSNANVIQLTATPAGGSWIGDNVLSDGTFNPAQSQNDVDTLIYAYTENGCTGFDTLEVTVRPAPGEFTVSTTNPSSCATDDGTATINGISLQPGWKVLWSIGAVSSTDFPTVSGLGGGIYQVSITDTISSCFRSVTFNLSDPEIPQPLISGLLPNYCSNDSCQTITVSPTSPSGFWSGPGVSSTQEGVAIFCPSAAGPGPVSIGYQYDNSSGCVGATSVNVLVNAAPTVNAGIFNDTLCTDDSPVQLEDFSPSSPPAIWGPQPLVSVNGLFSPSLASPGNNVLTLSLTSNGCTSISTRNIVVEQVPQPVISRSPAEQVCEGGQVTLTASAGSGVAVKRIEWFRNNQVIPNENNVSLNVTQAGSYSVVITGSGNCSGGSAALDVNFNGLPDATITSSGSSNPCSSQLSTLSAPAGSGFTYQWFIDQDSIAGATSSSITPSQSGFYRVRVRNASGCSKLSDFFTMNIRQAPQVSILAPAGDTCLQAGQPVTVSLAASGEGLTFQWFRQGTPNVALSGQTASVITGITEAGRYFAVASSTNGCQLNSDTINILATTPVSVQDSIIFKCLGDEPFQITGMSPGGCPLLYNGSPLANNLWNPNEAGDFIVTYQCTNANGCVSRKDIIIRVDPAPPSFLIVLGPTNLCQGDSVILQVNDGSESGFSYQLYRNGVPFGLPFLEPFKRVSQSGNYQVEVRFNRCNVLSNTVNINFRPIPQALAGSDLSVCGVLNSNLNSGAGITPGEWSGSPRVETSGDYVSNGFTGCDTLTLTVTQNGCSAQDTRIVCIKPEPNLQAQAQDASDCQVTDGKAWIVNATPGNSFSWVKSGSPAVISTTDSILNVEAGVYEVSITDASTSCTVVRSVIINTPNSLSVDIGGLPDSVCFGSEPIQLAGILVGQPTDAGVFSSFANRIIDGTVYDPTIPGPLVDTVYYTASLDGCVGTISKVIKLNALPVLDAGPDSRVCFGDTLVLEAIQPTGVPLVWIGPQVEGNNLFIANNNTISSSLVTVSYTRNGCTNTDTRLISIDTLPQFNVVPSDVSSCGSCDGGAIREISNSSQFQTIWRNIAGNTIVGTGSNLSNQCVGVYSVQVIRNTTGCSRTETFGISGPTNINPFTCLQNVPDGICQGGTPVAIGKCNPDAQIFIGGVQTDTLNPAALPPGNAQILLSLTDSNGCTGVEQITIPVRPQPIINVAGTSPGFACTGQSSVQLTGFFPAFDPAIPENGWTASSAPAGFISRSGQINPGVVADDALITLTYTVKSAGQDACASSKNFQFRVYKNPVASITPPGGIVTICQGEQALLTASPVSPGFTYKWLLGASNPQPIGFQSTLAATLPGQYSLEISNNGCVSGNTSVIQVVVNQGPTIVNITGNPTICRGAGAFTLPAPLVNPVSSLREWKPVSPTPSNFINAAGVVNPDSVPPGTYEVQFVATLGACSTSVTRTITIVPSVVSTIAGPESIEICAGQSQTLTADSTGSGFTYKWFRNGVEIPGATNQNLTVDSSGTYRVQIVIGGNASCSAVSTDFVDVLVKPQPIVTIQGNPVKSICLPSAPFLVSAENPYQPADAIWSSDVSGLITSGGFVQPSAIQNQGEINLILTKTIGGCSDSDTLLLKAYETPDALFGASALAICDGENILLSYNNPNNYNTAWSRNNSILAVGVDSITITTAGTYTLRVDNNQCFDEHSASYEVKPKPVFNLPTDTIICKNGNPVQFFPINPSPGSGSWSGPGINTTGGWNPSAVDVPESGPIILTYKLESEGCATSKSFIVDIGAVPVVSVSLSDDTVEVNEPVTISASGGVAFNWSPADGLSSVTGPSVIARVPESRTYKVLVSSAKGCKAEKSVEVIVDQEFTVYDAFSPNGDQKNDVWWVKNIKKYPDAVVKIFNRWGNLIYESEKGYPKPWDGKFEGEPVPPGAYYYIIQLGQGLTPKSGSITLVR